MGLVPFKSFNRFSLAGESGFGLIVIMNSFNLIGGFSLLFFSEIFAVSSYLG